MAERCPKWLKTLGKGEIACYKQFLLFPQCFQKACYPGASKGVTVCEWVKHQPSSQSCLFQEWSAVWMKQLRISQRL